MTSVELLLDMRTAAESACGLASRLLSKATGLDGETRVTGTTPGPADWPEARKFVVEAPSGTLGAFLVKSELISMLGDLIMGGRGVPSDEAPSALEIELFTSRSIEFLHAILDAVAPGRPEPVALIERDYPTPARSIVISLEVAHRDEVQPIQIEVLAHHLADDQGDLDDERMQEICQTVPIEMTFHYKPVQLAASQVAALEPGDVICLEHELDQPLVGEVSGKPMVHAKAGKSRRKVAVEVLDLIEGGA